MTEDTKHAADQGLSRRELLTRASAGAALLSAPGLLAACGGGSSPMATTAGGSAAGQGRSATPVRVGMSFGATSSLDPQATANGYIDQVRQRNVFDTLFDFDNEAKVVPRLATSLEGAKDATRWILKLRDGVVFHDGSPLTAADVVYSLRRIATKKNGLEGYSSLANLDTSQLKAIDDHTVRIVLRQPNSEFSSVLAQRTMSIVKAGTRSFATLNGTGPFKYKSEDPNNLVLVANGDYFIAGRPASAEVHCINMVEDTARFNGLQSGAIDVAPLDSLTLLPQIQGNSDLKAILSDKTGTWSAMAMSATKKPFDDVRVRQAMRLIANRKQIIEQAQSGYGQIGNDLFGRQDPLYASSIPQREPDVEQAKALLKAAGHEDTVFTLDASSAVGPNAVSSALVFAQQAKEAGVKVEVRQSSSDAYFTQVYGTVPFEQTAYTFRPLMTMWGLCLDPTGAFFAADTDYDDARSTSLYRTAMRTLDADKRRQLMAEAQRIQWERGGYLIWGYAAYAEATRSNVTGVEPSALGQLSNWALWDIRVG